MSIVQRDWRARLTVRPPCWHSKGTAKSAHISPRPELQEASRLDSERMSWSAALCAGALLDRDLARQEKVPAPPVHLLHHGHFGPPRLHPAALARGIPEAGLKGRSCQLPAWVVKLQPRSCHLVDNANLQLRSCHLVNKANLQPRSCQLPAWVMSNYGRGHVI